MSNYSNINELIRGERIDMSLWGNSEQKPFTKKKIYDKAKPNLRHVPNTIMDITVECDSGHSFKPNWTEKTPPPTVFRREGMKLIVQESYNILCPTCKSTVKYKLPVSDYAGNISVYGDEAMRVIGGKSAYVYCFCCCPGKKNEQKLISEIYRIKKRMSPKYSPGEWQIHLKELTSPEKRNKNPATAELTESQVNYFIGLVLKLIKQYSTRHELVIYAGVGVKNGINFSKKQEIDIKHDIYNSAAIHTIRECTAHNYAPMFFFEKTGNDGWAKKLFSEGRLTLLWAHICNGLPVKSPEFVTPDYHPFLEIADIVSFILGRYIFCVGSKHENKDVPMLFSPSSLGYIRYILSIGEHVWRAVNSTSFPHSELFLNTEWEASIPVQVLRK